MLFSTSRRPREHSSDPIVWTYVGISSRREGARLAREKDVRNDVCSSQRRICTATRPSGSLTAILTRRRLKEGYALHGGRNGARDARRRGLDKGYCGPAYTAILRVSSARPLHRISHSLHAASAMLAVELQTQSDIGIDLLARLAFGPDRSPMAVRFPHRWMNPCRAAALTAEPRACV